MLGDYLPSRLGMDEGERVLSMCLAGDYSGYMLFFFENGKVAKVELSSYATKTNRRKLLSAYSDKSPLVASYDIPEDREFVLTSSAGRKLILHTGAIQPKTTKNTQGVSVMTLKRGHRVIAVEPFQEDMFQKPQRYRTKTLPAAGALPAAEDTSGEQMKL